MDGTSFTSYLFNDVFGVCSRNLDLTETEGNSYWYIARYLDLERKMREFYPERPLAIQGEIIGEGIQGNKYLLKGVKFFAFNIFDIKSGEYVTKEEFNEICAVLGLDTVPVIETEMVFPQTVAEALAASALNPKQEREGLVWVGLDEFGKRVSFKTISNKFLASEKD